MSDINDAEHGDSAVLSQALQTLQDEIGPCKLEGGVSRSLHPDT